MMEVNLEKRGIVKKRLLQGLFGVITILGLSQFVSAGFIQKINGLDYVIGGATEKSSGEVNYTDGEPTSIVVGNRTITPTYNGDGLLETIEDDNFETNFTYTTDKTSWVTTKK
jgi:hypothetical protein